MKSNQDLISIILPVHNAELFLHDCLNSILAQTHNNWELIAIDDGSTDNSFHLLSSYAKKDNRIKVYRNKHNLGISTSLNKIIKLAKGQYLARMDADDIMLKNRLSLQLKFLKSHPDIIIVGGQCQVINTNGKKIGKKIFPLDHNSIYQLAFNRCPVQHPAILINRHFVPKNFVWYRTEHIPAEDLELFFRLFRFGQFANLPQTVLKYRRHLHNTSLINPSKTYQVAQNVRHLAVELYGYQPSPISQILNFVQFFIVSLLPVKLIYPLYLASTGNLKLPLPFPTLTSRFNFAR